MLMEYYFKMNEMLKNDLEKYWNSNKQKVAKEMMENHSTEADKFYDVIKKQNKEIVNQFSDHNKRFTMAYLLNSNILRELLSRKNEDETKCFAVEHCKLVEKEKNYVNNK